MRRVSLFATGGGLFLFAIGTFVAAVEPIPGGPYPPASPERLASGNTSVAGGRLKIVNDDDVLHNVHAYDEQGVTLFNFAQPFQGISNTATLRNPGVVRLVCDSGHGWMRGFVVVTESRHRAVTGADGAFSLEEVPPGDYAATEVRFEMAAPAVAGFH